MCQQLEENLEFNWIEIGKFAKDHGCIDSYDEVYKCPVIDEDKVLDELEDKIAEGGYIVDYHGCDFFPEHWFDIVFVLRTDNTKLYDRLEQRGYIGKKLQDNIQCEIFQTILEEARSTFRSDMVFELQSNTTEEMDANVEQITSWISKWQPVQTDT
ncbi:hypothetical protein B566_EDAN011399 [Ephemera danica]|nr:hypothetical protein B566_EDAN011399 [Ephemera danica]